MENLAIVLPLLWISLVIHELGHAYAAHEVGVRVERMSILGLPIGGTLRLPFRFPGMPDTELVVHPAVVGCYVSLAESDMETANQRDKLRVLSGGPIASIAFGFVLCIGAAICQVIAGSSPLVPPHVSLILCIGCAIAVLWIARQPIAEYALLSIGVAALMYAVSAVPVHDLLRASNVGFIVDLYHGKYLIGAPQSQTAYSAGAPLSAIMAFQDVYFAGLLSTMLGISNLIPIPPLDGGQMVSLFVPEKLQRSFAKSGSIIVLSIIFLTIGNDARTVLGFFF